MKKRVSLMLTIVLICTILLPTTPALALNSNELTTTINNYLTESGKAPFDYTSADKYLYNSDLTQAVPQGYLKKRMDKVRYWAETMDLRISNINTNTKIDSVEVSGETASANVTEMLSITYMYNSGQGANIPNSFEMVENHQMILNKKGIKWAIVEDKYGDTLNPELDVDHSTKISEKVKELKGNNNKLNSKTIQQSLSKTISPLFNTQQYMRNSAVTYADTYAYSYNPNYSNWISSNADCANFVSQALHDSTAGKLYTDGYWYPYSYDWVNADGLANYLVSNPRGSSYNYGYIVGSAKSLSLGDVIGYDWDGSSSDGQWVDHVAIVDGFDSAGNPLIAAHTTAHKQYPYGLGLTSPGFFTFIHLYDYSSY